MQCNHSYNNVCGTTELGSQGKLCTDDITFELVQRMITSLPGRLGEEHGKEWCSRFHLCPFNPFSVYFASA